MTENIDHDVIIVGAGAAGLSAGLVLARARVRTLLLDTGEPRNAPATAMHGFVSRDGMPPAEFLAAGRREVLHYGGVIRSARVRRVDRRADGAFVATLDGGDAVTARALLIATGLTDELPLIPGLRDRWGGSVHHCPYCHGHEVRDRSIVVIGGSQPEVSLRQTGLLRRYSDRVRFVTNGIPLSPLDRTRLESIDVEVMDDVVTHVVGASGSLTGLGLADGRELECEAVFVAPRPKPNDTLLTDLGCERDPATGFGPSPRLARRACPASGPPAMSSPPPRRSSRPPARAVRARSPSAAGCSTTISRPPSRLDTPDWFDPVPPR